MRSAFSASTRFISTTLMLVLFITSIAPAHYAFADLETLEVKSEAAFDPELVAREKSLRTYFMGCNNYISTELDAWKLKYDAGDRPSPIQMLGMNREEDFEHPEKVEWKQIRDDSWNETGSHEFLSQLHLQSLSSTISAYAHLLAEYLGQRPSPEDIVKVACSQGAGCPDAARPFALNVAKKAAAEVVTVRSWNNEETAELINAEVRKMNAALAEVKVPTPMTGFFSQFSRDLPVTPAMLEKYTKVYLESALKDGAMRLRAIPSLNEKVGNLQTKTHNLGTEAVWLEFIDGRHPELGRQPGLWSNGYGTTVRTQLFNLAPKDRYVMFKPHGYVNSEDIRKGVLEAKKAIEEEFADLNNAVSLKDQLEDRPFPVDPESGYVPPVLTPFEKAQASLGKLIAVNAISAHVVLLNNPNHPEWQATACRAFKTFAIDRARDKRFARYLQNAAYWGGAILALASVAVPIAIAGYVTIAAYAGAALTAAQISTIMATSALALSVSGVLVSGLVLYASIVAKETADAKLPTNVKAVLAGVEAPEVLVTRIPEEIEDVRSTRNAVFVNSGLLGLSAIFVVNDVRVWWGVGKGTKSLTAATGAALAKKELGLGGKLLWSTSRFLPGELKAISFKSFEELEGTEITFAENPGSDVFIHAKAKAFDDKRQIVVLNVLSRIGPHQQLLPIPSPFMDIKINEFRAIIRGTR